MSTSAVVFIYHLSALFLAQSWLVHAGSNTQVDQQIYSRVTATCHVCVWVSIHWYPTGIAMLHSRGLGAEVDLSAVPNAMVVHHDNVTPFVSLSTGCCQPFDVGYHGDIQPIINNIRICRYICRIRI